MAAYLYTSVIPAKREDYRPWGWYDSIDEGDRFKLKRIQVKPGSGLSLQASPPR